MLNKSVELKVVKDVLIFGGIILGLLCIFCFFGMYDIPLGFLLGLIISLINYAIVNVQTKIMLSKSASMSSVGLTLACYTTRFLLYGGALFLAFYLSYINVKLFAWYTVFIGFMLIKAIIFFKYGQIANRKIEDIK